MRGIFGIDPGWGITAVRIAAAIVWIHAGWLKWFRFGVSGGVTGLMAKYGLPVPMAFAYVAATLELVGGALMLIGLFARWIGLLYAVEFAIVFFFVKLRLGTFADSRLEMLLLASALLVLLAGPGRAALDELWLEKQTTERATVRRRAG